MKTLNLLAWASAGAGVLLMLVAVISELAGKNFLFLSNVNYFHCANSLFLITLVLFVYIIKCQCKKE